MAAREDIAAILADPALSSEQKRLAVMNRRALALATEFTRRSTGSFTLNGVRWTIHESALVEQNGVPMVRAVLSARVAPNGAWLIEQSSSRNPFYWVNPPVLVPDGLEADGTTPKYKEDLIAVGAAMLGQLLNA